MGKMTSMWAAEVPQDLSETHILLERYAEWAWAPSGPKGRCASAEGRYLAPGGQALEDRRQPLDLMTDKEAKDVQRALLLLDELHRGHLVLLYVRQREAVRVIKAGRVNAALSQARQIEGLRRMQRAVERLQRATLDTSPVPTITLAPHC